MKKIVSKSIFGGILVFIFSLFLCVAPTFADAISVSPMTQKIILNPGDSYTGSLTVFNQAGNADGLSYKAELIPFYADEDYNAVYEFTGDYNQIVDWVTLQNTEGILAPNSGADIYYTINVPLDAPSGGQYFAIRVSSIPKEGDENGVAGMGTNIKVSYGVAYMVFAEITGESERKGEILDVDVPSFILDGDITASSSVKNDGNVHDTAKYTLQIFPLFSSEEIFTNAEEPETHTVLPNRTLYNKTAWVDTPAVGVFNVIYTVEFEGVTTQVSKMVIKCPIWLLFIIIFVVFAIIIWLVSRAKMRKKTR